MKNKIILIILFLCCSFFSNALLYAQNEFDTLSGPQSLLAVFKALGVKSTLDEIKKLSDYDEVKGTTLNELSKAVLAKGLYAVEIKISIEELSKLKTPAIVYLWNDSFKAINGFEQDKIRIINAEEESIWMSKKDLNNVYSGFALLVSKDKTLFPEMEIKGSNIRFNEYIYHFGVVKGWEVENKKLDYIFKFKNTGNKELVISRVQSSCGCTAAIISGKNVPPGGEGEIKATFNIEGRTGNQSTSVNVFSNDPVTPIIKLQLKVIIKENKLQIIPLSVNLGNVNRKSIPTQILHITPPEGEELTIIKIDSSSEYISTKFSENKREDLKGFELAISINPNIPISELNGKITVYTSNKEYPKIEIPVKGEIKGDIEVRPPKFFFGLAGEMREAKVVISTIGEKPLNIERIENSLEFVSVRITTNIEDKEYGLTATLQENTPPLNIKGNIIIYTNNPEQPRIEIPVYCLASSDNSLDKK